MVLIVYQISTIYWLLILGTLFKDCLSVIHKFVNGNFWLVFWNIMVPLFKISMVGKWYWVIGRGRKEEKKTWGSGGIWGKSLGFDAGVYIEWMMTWHIEVAWGLAWLVMWRDSWNSALRLGWPCAMSLTRASSPCHVIIIHVMRYIPASRGRLGLYGGDK